MLGDGGAYARITVRSSVSLSLSGLCVYVFNLVLYLQAYNSTTLTYEHVVNNGGAVTDEWTVTQSNHGPFKAVKKQRSA